MARRIAHYAHAEWLGKSKHPPIVTPAPNADSQLATAALRRHLFQSLTIQPNYAQRWYTQSVPMCAVAANLLTLGRHLVLKPIRKSLDAL